MKFSKYILLVFVIFLFPVIAKAEEYATNAYGYYSINNATCIYSFEQRNNKIIISFKDDTISSIKWENPIDYSIYEGTISLITFYDNTTKEFKCPKELYGFDDTTALRGRGTAYYLDAGYNNFEDYPHDILKVTSDTSVTYNKKNINTLVESFNIICQFRKQSSSYTGSIYQQESPAILNYVKYISGKNGLISETNDAYEIASGNINCENSNYLYLKINSSSKSYDVVEGCSEISNNCVIYQRADIANRIYDSGVNMDGTNNNSSEQITPNIVKKYNPKIEKFDCTSLLGDPYDPNHNTPAYYLSFAFKIIRYIAIIILIVLSSMDFVSAVASHDDDELKKAMNKTIKRLVLCIVIFLLPTLLEFILKYINDREIGICINTQ